MTTTPAGWYDDGHGTLRWWDGARWTEHTHVPDAAPAASPYAPVSAPAETYAPVPPAATTYGPGAPATQATPYGAYPGGTGAPYLPAAPPPKPKSNRWIVWVALGVLALAIVISAAVYLPMLIVGAVESAAQPSGDEQAAVDAVHLYDDAWDEADCDKYMQATTESFRQQLDITDCASFEDSASYFTDSTDDYTLEVTDVQHDGDSILVSTSETYTTTVDDSGQPLDPPQQAEDLYTYTVVAVDQGWAIDSADSD